MWYSTGTVSVTNGSSTVTGSGTAFLANARIGDGIVIQGSTAMHEIIGIASDTSLTIRPGYTGTTGAGRQFAVAPMLGYDKDLSDAFNEIRLQFGDTLSELKPWAYAATANAALDALGFSGYGKNIVSGDAENTFDALGFSSVGRTVATGTAEAARNELGLGSAAQRQALGTAPLYGRDSVVGTVSQSGGVPTGALVEYGSNENGEFWRYAGGMQICKSRRNLGDGPANTSVGNLFLGYTSALTFAAAFVSPPEVNLTVISPQGQALNTYVYAAYILGLPTASSYFPVVISNRSLSNGPRVFSETAVGRWH